MKTEPLSSSMAARQRGRFDYQLSSSQQQGKEGASMTAKYPVKKEFQSGNGYSKEDWDAVDSPELTDEELASARPAAEVLPNAFFDHVDEVRRGRGRPALEQTKQTITIRLDPDVIEHYRSSGRGWQSRINDDLRKLSGLGK
jgi:uncharacterized protein (DUF4415 family)